MPRDATGKSYITVYMSDNLKDYLKNVVVKAEVFRTGDPDNGSISSFGLRAIRESIAVRLSKGYIHARDIPNDVPELADLKAKFSVRS